MFSAGQLKHGARIPFSWKRNHDGLWWGAWVTWGQIVAAVYGDIEVADIIVKNATVKRGEQYLIMIPDAAFK